MQTLAPFLTPFLLGTGLYFVENLCASFSRRLILFLSITISSLWSISISPYSSPMSNFLTGMGSAWYIIWSADLLFIQDPHNFKRLQIHAIPKGRKTDEVYKWQPTPKKYTLARLFWVLDLITNLRELGWQHGLHKKSLPPLQKRGKDTSSLDDGPFDFENSSFLAHQIRRAVMAFIFMAMYERAPFPVQDLLLGFIPSPLKDVVYHNICLWAWTFYIYFLLNFTHSAIAIIAVGLLGKPYLGTAGELWMYPPIFGPARPFFTTWEVGAFWGQWWHNVLRRSLLSIPRRVVPDAGSAQLYKVMLISGSFVLSACFHAAACYCVAQGVRAAGMIFLCFFLQPFPIIIQRVLSQLAAQSQPLLAIAIRCTSVGIGFAWISWSLPQAVLNPAIVSVQETFCISSDIDWWWN